MKSALITKALCVLDWFQLGKAQASGSNVGNGVFVGTSVGVFVGVPGVGVLDGVFVNVEVGGGGVLVDNGVKPVVGVLVGS